jgi:CheY-like chemotaxis protein
MINILVVDDERLQRVFMSKLIKRIQPDSKIDNASDGNEAIERCINFEDYHVIFMDLTMPFCDGFTATETIRMLNENVLIYTVTAFGEDTELKQKCIEARMNGYYTKPLKKENIKEVLALLLKEVSKTIKE